MKVLIDPNNLKLVELPVIVSAEVSGTVYMNDIQKKKGLGKIVVLIYNQDSVLVGRSMTESDGYFSLMGLKPGNYAARIDPVQLQKLDLQAVPAVVPFTIERSTEGDFIDDLEFTLNPLKEETRIEK